MPSHLSALLRTPSCLAALALIGSMSLAGCPAFVSDDYSSDGTDPDSGGAGGDTTGGAGTPANPAGGTTPNPPDPGKPTCDNGKKDGGETDVDCGRDCPNKCANEKSCASNEDCQSGSCWGGRCRAQQETACENGKKDVLEADIDCGAVCPDKCAKDKRCKLGIDCASGDCDKGKCR